MSDRSAIEWTEATWNPTTGCDRVSEGCDNCYALRLAGRLKAAGSRRYQVDGNPKTSGPGFGLTLHWDKITQPLSWRQGRFIFVNSMSDLFHPDVPREFIRQVFEVMAATPQHRYQILTKRPGRMASILRQQQPDPLPNVWLGSSIETDHFVWRANLVRSTPAAVRFLSLEPLLGPLPGLDLEGIDWVIVGGESGPGHRFIDPHWVRDLREECLSAGVAFFFKQWGGRTPKAGGRTLDGRTWDQMPSPELTRTRAASAVPS